MNASPGQLPEEDHIHEWFGLTYANYLVLPRALLQSMPDWWQEDLVRMLRWMDQAYPDWKWPTYRVLTVDETGHYIPNKDPHYNRGRTHIEPRAIGRPHPWQQLIWARYVYTRRARYLLRRLARIITNHTLTGESSSGYAGSATSRTGKTPTGK